ncbi:MAG: hypothetical protein EX271_09250 [Acidimicrobiales bacterium]|nr:hypothetical protein [Hyphomonadaceae bacterium]RZV40880.1 MAG: hypothetical protein EX271_09250 [Acidimicrobiales bacterium]
MKKLLKILIILAILLVGIFKFVLHRMNHEIAAVTPLPMSTEGVDLTATIDPNFQPKQMAPTGEPQHPYMAVTDTSAMHSGTWESDTHPARAVFSKNPKVLTRRAGGTAPRQCATFTFTSEGYPLILCGGLTSFRLQLLDPDDLTLLAFYDLPMRPSTLEAGIKRDSDIIFTDTSGGAYFYLDHEDRAVLADSKQRIRRIKPVKSGDTWEFVETDSWDMTEYLPRDCFKLTNQNPKGECDAITTVQPDYNGLLWWVTRNGRIGSLDMETGKVVATDLGGEEIQNSFALDESGAYIVSDHAMYHMRLIDGMPTQTWRIPYDRGTSRKVGSINQGSGTSPSLLRDYVTYTDNADDHMNIHVARRGELEEGQERHICQVPVFTKGASVTDNSMITHGRSIILENNAGYTNSMIQKDYNDVEGGVVRVDVREDESGCDIIWTNDLKVPSVVPKLSLGNGIAYFYSFDLLDNGDRLWSLVGLDFETGKEVIRVPTGTGEAYNNNWASIAIAPNGDTYVGTRRGILKVTDQ